MAANLDRRQVLTVAAAGAGAGAIGLLAACGSSDTAAPPASAAATGAPAGPVSSSGPAAPPAGVLGTVADAPVGGGFVAADAPIVVTQPTAGQFKAFSAICTHAGCLVGEIASNEIICPCHGSVFSAQDGSVISGPATEPLAPVAISVSGDSIVAS